jgi:hypothetical protein
MVELLVASAIVELFCLEEEAEESTLDGVIIMLSLVGLKTDEAIAELGGPAAYVIAKFNCDALIELARMKVNSKRRLR